jgi:hypothetical protein
MEASYFVRPVGEPRIPWTKIMKLVPRPAVAWPTWLKRAVSSRGAIAQSWWLLSIRAVGLLLVVLICSGGSSAYSVLTHEEIVDLLWTDETSPSFSRDIRDCRKTRSGRPMPALRRSWHPGSRLLPVRQSGIQQPGALRAQRKLCS